MVSGVDEHWNKYECGVQDGTIRQKNTGLCMEVTADGKKLEMKACTGEERQRWQWTRKETAADANKNR